MAKTKKQHYVPQFLLENFSFNKKSQVWVFDKHTELARTANIRDIAHENHFNEIETSDGTKNLESFYADIETVTAPLIKRILENKSLADLTIQEKSIIGFFILTQSLRTRHQINMMKHAESQLMKWIIPFEMQASEVEVPDGLKGKSWKDIMKMVDIDINEDYVKLRQIQSLPKLAEDVLPRLMSMDWFLFETTEDHPFWIGDCGTTMCNEKNFGPYGNIGFLVPYIQIYLPLSSRLMLGLWCPMIRHEISNAYIRASVHGLTGLANEIYENGRFVFDAYSSYIPIKVNAENVKFYNSNQVWTSERLLISPKSNFELVQQMIADDPKFKQGGRGVVA